LNSGGSEGEASKESDTSSKDSELEIKSANVTRDKTPQVTWQRNKIHTTAYTEDLSPHTIGQAYEVGGSCDALVGMGQPQSLVRESYETGSHFMSYFDNFVGQSTLLVMVGQCCRLIFGYY